MSVVDYALRKEALTGFEGLCGDTGLIKEYDKTIFLALVDGLGHGDKANSAALLAERYFSDHYRNTLPEILEGLHCQLKQSVGVVAGIGKLKIETGELAYAGIGNITARIYGADTRTLISRDGVIGYSFPIPHVEMTRLVPGDMLILTSDGISNHFKLEEYPGLLEGAADYISCQFLNRLKKNDDASCIVLRYQ